jgi:hypothetical protein
MNARSIRSRLAAVPAGLAAVALVCADPPAASDAAARLVERSRASKAAPMRGDAERCAARAGWTLVHRHADPLVAGITLPEATALGRRAPAGG